MTVDDMIDSLVAFKYSYGGDHDVCLIKEKKIDIIDIKRIGSKRKCLLITSEDIVTKQEMLGEIDKLKDAHHKRLKDLKESLLELKEANAINQPEENQRTALDCDVPVCSK